MPPLPPVPNVFKLAISGTDSGGNRWANVLHYLWTGTTPTAAIATALAGDISALWVANVTPVQSVGTTMTDVTLTDLTSSTGAVGSYASAAEGSRAGAILPGSAAFLISYPGAGPRYRGGHPRTYLLAGTNSDLATESTWTTGAVTAITTGFVTFAENVTGQGNGGCNIGTQCAVSYYTTNYLVTPHTRIRKSVPDVYEINNIIGQTQLASQRGRIGRRRS